MSFNSSAILDPPAVINHPPKTARPQRRWRFRDKQRKCPYCLQDLTDYDPNEYPGFGYFCPICRHAILDHLLTTPLFEFNRFQQWDLLANEMEYIWDGEQRDVNSYVETMGGFYNPDFSDAKERLLGMFIDKDAVLRLREEFLEAEGELDNLVIGYLDKKRPVWDGMADRLRRGHPLRVRARHLSARAYLEREKIEFQVGLLKATPWGSFGSPSVKEKLVESLEEFLKDLSRDQGNMGA